MYLCHETVPLGVAGNKNSGAALPLRFRESNPRSNTASTYWLHICNWEISISLSLPVVSKATDSPVCRVQTTLIKIRRVEIPLLRVMQKVRRDLAIVILSG